MLAVLVIVSCLAVYSSSIPMRESPPMKNTTIVNNTMADNGPYPLESVSQSRNGTVAGNSTQPEPEFLAGQDPTAVDDYHDIVEQNRENLYEWAEKYGLLEQLQKYEKSQQKQQQQSKQVTQQTTVTKANGTAAAPPAAAPPSSSSSAPAETTTTASTDNTTTASGNSTTTTKKPNSSWGTTVSLALLPIIVVQVL